MIAHLRLKIEKLRRALYGVRSERKARLLEQMELQLEELETSATEDETAAVPMPPPHRLSASARRANRFPSICRASAWSCLRRPAAPAADRRSCRSSARTSLRRWR